MDFYGVRPSSPGIPSAGLALLTSYLAALGQPANLTMVLYTGPSGCLQHRAIPSRKVIRLVKVRVQWPRSLPRHRQKTSHSLYESIFMSAGLWHIRFISKIYPSKLAEVTSLSDYTLGG